LWWVSLLLRRWVAVLGRVVVLLLRRRVILLLVALIFRGVFLCIASFQEKEDHESDNEDDDNYYNDCDDYALGDLGALRLVLDGRSLDLASEKREGIC